MDKAQNYGFPGGKFRPDSKFLTKTALSAACFFVTSLTFKISKNTRLP
jgi:hypothetical protein